MELRHIRYFLMVAEERSFTRAAALLGIAQPPLSAQIRQLEEEVGVPLFRRLPQGVELSAAGSAFLDIVQGMPSLTYRATEAALRAARGETGAINLGFTPSLAFNGAVTSTIAAYRRAYPDIALGLEETNTARLLEGLREGSIDAAFLRPYESDGETVDLIPICKEPMIAALPDGHPAAADATVELKQLAGDSILLFPRQIGPRLYDIVVEACRAAGFEPRLGQTTPQIASMINLVAAGARRFHRARIHGTAPRCGRRVQAHRGRHARGAAGLCPPAGRDLGHGAKSCRHPRISFGRPS